MENITDKIISEDKESEQISEANLTCELQTANEETGLIVRETSTCVVKSDESGEGVVTKEAAEQQNQDIFLEEQKAAAPVHVIEHIIIRAEQILMNASEYHENQEADGSTNLGKDTSEDTKITDTKEIDVSVNTEPLEEINNQHKEITEDCGIEVKLDEVKNIEESGKQTNKEDRIEAQPTESLNMITPSHNDNLMGVESSENNLTTVANIEECNTQTLENNAIERQSTEILNVITSSNDGNLMDVESSVNDCAKASTEETPMEIITHTATESSHEILNQENNIESTIVPLESVSKSIPSGALSMLAQYDSENDSDNDSISDVKSIVEVPTSTSLYRNRVVEINSDSDTDTSSGSVEYLNEIRKTIEKSIELDNGDDEDDDEYGDKTKRQPPRVKGEFLIDDLPPIEDLHITVPEEECVELGKVHSVVDQLVLVSALPNSILLDLETVLFLERGKRVLGEVFDVLGQVSDPLYCVRFNSNQQIKEKNIQLGDVVFVAPKTQYTQFVILSSLMKARGSDASWENDVEPPPRFLAYSDDEQERAARAKLRGQNRPNDHNDATKRSRSELESPSPSPSPLPSSAPREPFNQFRERGAGGGGGRGGRGRFRTPRHTSNSSQDYHQPTNYNRGSWHSNYPQPYHPPQTHHWHGQQFMYSQHPNFGTYSGHAQAPMRNGQPPATLPHRQHPPAPSPTPPLYVMNPYAVRPPILPPSSQQFPGFVPSVLPPPPPGAE